MRIGIFDPYLDDYGGGEKYMMTIAECLSEKHEVIVFWDYNNDIDAIAKRFSLDLSKVSLEKNIFSTRVGIFERLFVSSKFDVIIVLSDGSIPFVFSRKLLIHFQQPLIHISKNIKTKFKLSRVSSIFCNSVFTKSFIDKAFRVNSNILYPPVEIKTKKSKKENVILTVGRFRVRDPLANNSDFKKLSILVDVFKDMTKKGLKDWKFILAVSVKDEEREALDKLMNKTQGFPIDFLINKTNDELWEIYSKAKIYWHAAGYGEDLKEHPEFAEHFGISTVEAMGAGVVPVVISAGGQLEIVEEGKTGFLWDTLEELKEKTENLIRDASLVEKISEKAQVKAKTYTKERFRKEIYELLAI